MDESIYFDPQLRVLIRKALGADPRGNYLLRQAEREMKVPKDMSEYALGVQRCAPQAERPILRNTKSRTRL